MADDYHVTVDLDMAEVTLRGAEFIKTFEWQLGREFHEALALILKKAQELAPVGYRDYAIDADGKSIRKIAGGTLRRDLTMAVQDVMGQLLRGEIGVRSGSPASKYARMAEIGGTIKPTKGQFLRFSPDGQTIVYARVVHRAAHPYIMPALIYGFPLLQMVPHRAFIATRGILGI